MRFDAEEAYVVLHCDPGGLVASQGQRDQIFGTGNVIDLIESPVYSFQTVHIEHITRRPLYVVLWGMADRYGTGPQLGVGVLEANDFSTVLLLCEGRRPRIEQREGGYEVAVWEKPGGATAVDDSAPPAPPSPAGLPFTPPARPPVPLAPS